MMSMSDSKEKKTNRMITAVLAVIIIIAAISILYVTIPQKPQPTDQNNEGDGWSETDEPATVLTMIFGDEQVNYTLEELEDLEAYEGSGAYIKTGWLPAVKIEGPYNYTGVQIITLLDEIDDLPVNYTITVEASDGVTREFNMSYIVGNVDIYNETGIPTSVGGVITLLAYKEASNYLNESTGGPLRMVYVGDGAITDANLWIKNIVSIEINIA